MINAMENLLERRSIRKYKSDPIPQDVLDSILEAGTYAATGMNRHARARKATSSAWNNPNRRNA